MAALAGAGRGAPDARRRNGDGRRGARRSGSVGVNLFGGGTQRIQLGETSWIEHIPGWLAAVDAAELLANLIASAAWEQRDRWMVNRRVLEPRLTAEYNDLADVPDPALRAAAKALSAQFEVPYDGLWINFYRDHRDSTGWHGDWPTCKRPECIVPVLSLGAPRRFLIKPRSGGRSVGFTPAGGGPDRDGRPRAARLAA